MLLLYIYTALIALILTTSAETLNYKSQCRGNQLGAVIKLELIENRLCLRMDLPQSHRIHILEFILKTTRKCSLGRHPLHSRSDQGFRGNQSVYMGFHVPCGHGSDYQLQIIAIDIEGFAFKFCPITFGFKSSTIPNCILPDNSDCPKEKAFALFEQGKCFNDTIKKITILSSHVQLLTAYIIIPSIAFLLILFLIVKVTCLVKRHKMRIKSSNGGDFLRVMRGFYFTRKILKENIRVIEEIDNRIQNSRSTSLIFPIRSGTGGENDIYESIPTDIDSNSSNYTDVSGRESSHTSRSNRHTSSCPNITVQE